MSRPWGGKSRFLVMVDVSVQHSHTVGSEIEFCVGSTFCSLPLVKLSQSYAGKTEKGSVLVQVFLGFFRKDEVFVCYARICWKAVHVSLTGT